MKPVVLIALFLVGCTTLAPDRHYSEQEMRSAAAALSKVAAAAEANLRYGSSPETQSDAAFLADSVAHDPTLMKPLAGYQIKPLRQNGHAIILLCSEDGKTALIEDAGCSAASDRQHWQDTPPRRCAFSIDTALICPGGQH